MEQAEKNEIILMMIEANKEQTKEHDDRYIRQTTYQKDKGNVKMIILVLAVCVFLTAGYAGGPQLLNLLRLIPGI